MSFDYKSPEAEAGRERFLNGQEALFDLVVERHGGVLTRNKANEVYDLYVKEGLDTEQVAERIAQFDDTEEDIFMVTPEQRIAEALNVAHCTAGVDGAHHKDECIDEMIRALTGPGYRDFVVAFKAGEDGPDTYSYITEDN